MSPTLGIDVELGGTVGFAARRGGARAEVRGAVPRRVLAVLALEQRPVSRDELGDAVWGDDLPRTWETALRGAVQKVRRAAAAVDADAPDVVRTAFGCYQLDPSVRVELLGAATALETAERLLAAGDAEAAATSAAGAAAVLADPLLPGLDGEWLDRSRRRFEPLRSRALLALSAASTACGEHGRAVDAAEAAVALDPYQEQAHRQLMTAHAAGGDRAAALLAYRRCRELLAGELGVLPSDQTEAVMASVAQAAAPVTPVVLPATLDTSLALAGRGDELAVLERALGAIGDAGHGATVAITGPAGTGKSRLAAEAAVLAFRRGAAVAHGRFDPDDLGALGAFREVLGQVGVAWPPPEAAGGGDRAELFGVARDALRRAGGRGLVVVLDDAHWADRPSLALLGDLANDPVPGLLVVVTARDDWMPPSLAEILDVVERIDLMPLDLAGTAALVGAWAGQPPADGAVEQLQRRTGGNPYFITALLQHLEGSGDIDLATGGIDLDGVDLPASVPDLVAAAVGRCGSHAAGIALQAAVLGDEFRPDVLAEVLGLPTGTVAATLERLAHVRVLGRAGDDARRFRFVHALVRRSVLDAAAAELVRAAHRAAAAVLAEAAPRTPELLAHLLGAGDAAALEGTVELGLEVAADLEDAGAPDEAVTILETLLARLEAGPPRPSLRGAVLMGLAAAEVSRDRLAEGRRALIGAAQLAVTARDPSILRTGVVLLRPPTAAEHDPEAIDVATRLLALAEPGSDLDVSVRCWLSAEVGATDTEASAALARQALDDAEALDEPTLHRLAGLTWHLMARGYSHPTERRSVLASMLAAPLPAAGWRGRGDAMAQVFLAGDCLELGDRTGTERAVAAALASTGAGERTHLRWLALRNQVMLRALDGDLDGADEALADVFEVAAALPIPEAVTLPLMQQVLNRYHQHRLDELQPLISAFAAAAPLEGPVPIVAGWIDAELGVASAAESVDRAVATALALPRNAGWLGTTAIAVEAAAAVGHPATAELAARLEPRSGQHVVIVTIGYLGAVDRYLALAARAAGHHDRAAVLFDRAQAQHRAVGAPCYLERTARELARRDPAA
jgi:DNA-binding SARP family transcriptional activator